MFASELNNESKKFWALMEEKIQVEKIYSTKASWERLPKDVIEGIAQTGKAELNLALGLVASSVFLLIDGMKQRKLEDIEHRLKPVVARIQELSKFVVLPPLPKKSN